jgi:hypothetical protein
LETFAVTRVTFDPSASMTQISPFPSQLETKAARAPSGPTRIEP